MIVDLLAEDTAHERLLAPLIERLGRESHVTIEVRVRSARGGHPRVLDELTLYQTSVARGIAERPDVLVVAIDSNCSPYVESRRRIDRTIEAGFREIAVVACPDPHIERWYLADPGSFAKVIGREPKLGRRKCDRDRYKRYLAEAVGAAGHPVLLGGVEFADEIVAAMDVYRAGKNEKSLKHFVDDLRRKVTAHRERGGA